jgi:hypothetical protein
MIKSNFKLRIPASKLKALAPRYPADYDREVEFLLAPTVRGRGYFTKPEFESICHWKTPRSQRKVASNSVAPSVHWTPPPNTTKKLSDLGEATLWEFSAPKGVGICPTHNN